MTPIERMHAKAAALATLGLKASASSTDLRKAWKRRALETHPDRPEGELEDFLRAKEAFETLSFIDLSATGPRGPGFPRSIRRGPRVEAREQQFSERFMSMGKALLDDVPQSDAADHVAEAVHRSGRHLAFSVSTGPAPGTNRVALPAAILARSREAPPEIISIVLSEGSSNEVLLPGETVRDTFPGARSVTIRFGAARTPSVREL